MYVPKEKVLFSDKGGNITQRMLGYHDKLMAVEMTFQKGSHVAPHSHPDHIQGIYIVRGKFEITCGGVVTVVGPGEMFYADYGEEHATICLEDNSVLLDMHTPMRADILQDSLTYNHNHQSGGVSI